MIKENSELFPIYQVVQLYEMFKKEFSVTEDDILKSQRFTIDDQVVVASALTSCKNDKCKLKCPLYAINKDQNVVKYLLTSKKGEDRPYKSLVSEMKRLCEYLDFNSRGRTRTY